MKDPTKTRLTWENDIILQMYKLESSIDQRLAVVYWFIIIITPNKSSIFYYFIKKCLF